MIVVVIVAVMFAVAMPSLRGMSDNNRLRSSVREITNLMKYARTEAVFNGRTTEVFLDYKNHQFWLDLRNPDQKGKISEKKKQTTERKRDLEKNVSFDAINAEEQNILKNDIIAVDFFPDGTASSALITLQNSKKTKYTIEITKATGQVTLRSGSLEDAADGQASEQFPLPDDYYDSMSANEAVR